MGLADLGFTTAQERIYRALVDQPDASEQVLCRLTDLEPPAVRAAISGLVDLGVVRRRDDGLAVPNPAVALGLLIERREDEALARYRRVVETRAEITELERRHGHANSAPEDPHGIERLDGVDAVRARLEELSFYHRRSAYSIQPGGPQSQPSLDAARPLNLRTLRRNLELKIIFEHSAIDDELNRASMRELVAHGAQIRLVRHPADRMLIVDEEIALVPIDPRDSKRGAIVVRQPALVAGFLDLFHRVWDESEELPWSTDSTPPQPVIDADDVQVLALLASGCTDETAARELGLSVRHLRRRIARLMAELDARSRFEAGVEAARRGWI